MTQAPEAVSQPENDCAILTGQFQEIIDFRVALLRIYPDSQLITPPDDELMERRRKHEAFVKADETGGMPAKGPLVLINGLALSRVTNPENKQRIEERLFEGGLLDEAERANVSRIMDSIAESRRIFGPKGLNPYNIAISHAVNTLKVQTDERIARGEVSAMGLRLLGLAAYWGTATEARLRIQIQDEIAKEYVR